MAAESLDGQRLADFAQATQRSRGKERWAHALAKNLTTAAFRGAGDKRNAARRNYLSLAPEARTESYLEVIDEVLVDCPALGRLTRNARLALARKAHVVEFSAGEALCCLGEQQDCLLVVMSGEVEVVEGCGDGGGPEAARTSSRHSTGTGSSGGLGYNRRCSAADGASSLASSRAHAHGVQLQPQPLTPPPQLLLPRTPLSTPLTPSSAQRGGGGIGFPQQATPSSLPPWLSAEARGPPPSPLSPHSQTQSPSMQHPSPWQQQWQQGGAALQLEARAAPHPALLPHPRTPRGGGSSGGATPRQHPLNLPHHQFSAHHHHHHHNAPHSAHPQHHQLGSGRSLVQPCSPALSRTPQSATPGSRPRPGGGSASASSTPRFSSQYGDMPQPPQQQYGGGGGRDPWVAGPWSDCAASLGSGGVSGGDSGSGGGSSDGGPSLLRRGDSLGAVDLGWLSQLRLSHVAAPAGPPAAHLTSRAVLATRAETEHADVNHSAPAGGGGAGSGDGTGHGSGGSGTGTARSTGTGGPPSRALAKSISFGKQLAAAAAAKVGLGSADAASAAEDVDASPYKYLTVRVGDPDGPEDKESGPAVAAAAAADANHGEPHGSVLGGGVTGWRREGGGGSDALDGLRWRCSAVAVGHVECLAVELRQLAGVLSSEPGWDVEVLVCELEELPVFAPLGPQELRQLARLLRSQIQPGGTVVYKQGTVGNELFIIRSGYVRLLQRVALGERDAAALRGMAGQLAGAGQPSPAAAAAAVAAAALSGGCHDASSAGSANPLAGAQHRSGAVTHRERSPLSSSAPPSRGSYGRLSPQLKDGRQSRGGVSDGDRATGGRRRHSGTAVTPLQPPPSPLRTSPQPRPRSQPASPLLPQAPSASRLNHSQPQHSTITIAAAASGSAGAGAAVPPRRSSGGGGAGAGGIGSARRRRSSAAGLAADEVLDRLGVVPRTLGQGQSQAPVPPRRCEAGFSESDLVAPEPPSLASASPSPQPSPPPSPSPDIPDAAEGLPPVAAAAPPQPPQPRLPLHRLATSTAPPPPAPAAPPELVFVELGTLGAGQCFGEVRPDGVSLRSSSAVTDTRAELLAISRGELQQRLGGRVFEYLWNQVPTEGAPPSLDPCVEPGSSAAQLQRSLAWSLYKQRLVAEVLARRGERRRAGALVCR